jgi:hypothetical protein
MLEVVLLFATVVSLNQATSVLDQIVLAASTRLMSIVHANHVEHVMPDIG